MFSSDQALMVIEECLRGQLVDPRDVPKVARLIEARLRAEFGKTLGMTASDELTIALGLDTRKFVARLKRLIAALEED